MSRTPSLRCPFSCVFRVCLLWCCLGLSLTGSASAGDPPSFVNFESPHVHPLELTPDGSKLLAVNTSDQRLEVFTLSSALDGSVPEWTDSIAVGLEPVSVRARTDNEVWVVNQVSDTLSVVDLSLGQVVRTIETGDEPADVVFAGAPERAFVSASGADQIWVHSLADGQATVIDLEGDHPRALATDGSKVSVAILRSGNNTTILGGGNVVGDLGPDGYPPNIAEAAAGPYGGTNPPPNAGDGFEPPQRVGNPSPPRVPHIVRKRSDGQWTDDNGGNWTSVVSGAQASLSGRVPGWDLLDHDLAVIDATTLDVSYAKGLTHLGLALAQRSDGRLTLVGQDAINEIRFEPNLAGRFVRVELKIVDPGDLGTATSVDLNPHLDYQSATLPVSERAQTLADPRSIVWNADGSAGFIAGMGSGSVIRINGAGARVGSPIDVAPGPTGLALDAAAGSLYVLGRFGSQVQRIDVQTSTVTSTVSFYDPTPEAARAGRRNFYDARETSGTGLVSCASCHTDGKADGLAWDLGDPSGEVKPFDQQCDFGCTDWHPMKGPLVTQTMQDIIGKEPLHWRGDRFGIEEFNGAFETLLGDDEQLTDSEMEEFKSFLSILHFPPNPWRLKDNTLSDDVALPGHFTTGRFSTAGQPLPNGDANRGLTLFRSGNLNLINCNDCHSFPTGMSLESGIPPGPEGELHHGILGIGNVSGVTVKVPQLRNLADKRGFNTLRSTSTRGFGYLHNGSVDSLERFVSEPIFAVQSDQDVSDLLAFLFSLSGSDLPEGSEIDPDSVGTRSQDAHAAVGMQWTIDADNKDSAQTLDRLGFLSGLADNDAIGLVVKGLRGGEARGWVYQGSGGLQSDRQGESTTLDALRSATAANEPVTITAVPKGTEVRSGVDRDSDGFFDRDELDVGSDPADAGSVPDAILFEDGFETGDTSAWTG